MAVHGASLEKDEAKTHREGKTLGLLTVGAQTLSSGVGTAGKVLGTAVGVMSAIKPLILLGVGKCEYSTMHYVTQCSIHPICVHLPCSISSVLQ